MTAVNVTELDSGNPRIPEDIRLENCYGRGGIVAKGGPQEQSSHPHFPSTASSQIQVRRELLAFLGG